MPSALESIGLITEILTWVGLVPGLLLLLAGWIVRHSGVKWCSADGVVFMDGEGTGFRWFDKQHGFLQARLPVEQERSVVPGSDVLIYYDAHRPMTYRTTPPPERGTILLLLGKILTAVGVAAFVAGLIVMLML